MKIRLIYFNVVAVLLFMLEISSCKKDDTPYGPGTSSLTIVNGFTGYSILSTYFGETNHIPLLYNQFQLVSMQYGSSKFYSSYNGQQKLSLYALNAYPDTTISNKPVYDVTLDLPLNTIHTLFLAGTASVPDQLFTTDQLPYHPPADSVMGIRFVNISQGNSAVSINLAGQTSGSEVSSLSYKSITSFKNYPANSAISSYSFEFRDKTTGVLLGTCLLDGINLSGAGTEGPNTWRNRNFTLAFLATPGGDAPFRVLIIAETIDE